VNLYIINPAGRGNSGLKTWKRFRELWPGDIDPGDILVTEYAGHAREVASTIEGYDVLVAVGGDGTVGEIMSGILDRPEGRPLMAVIPGGTGNDIARNAGIISIEDGVKALQEGRISEFDLIRVDYTVEGRTARRYAFLLASAGFSGNVSMRPWMKRLLGATGAYYLSTFLQILTFKPPRMKIRADERTLDKPSWMVLVGNSETSSGGSMMIAPGASPDDGELNVTVFPSRSRLGMVMGLFPRIGTGTHIDEPDVEYFPARKIEVDSDPPALIDLDGDPVGYSPFTCTVCPGLLRLMSLERDDI
jgi:diacylglycerol kinase (ATP)